MEPPPANFHMNDEILDVFTGPDGIWHILKHEHTTRGGEAADDLSDGVPLAAVSFVDKILKSKSFTEKIRVSCEYWLTVLNQHRIVLSVLE